MIVDDHDTQTAIGDGGSWHTATMACAVALTIAVTLPFDRACALNVSFGDRLYHDKADCQFCHGVNGDGRGDPRSPGKAPNLHETKLNRDQLIEVIGCGRPATEMPHFDKYAYEDKSCYGLSGGRARQEISRPSRTLRR